MNSGKDSKARATQRQADYAISLAKKPGAPEHLKRDAEDLAVDVLDFYKGQWTKQMASELIESLVKATGATAGAKKAIVEGDRVQTLKFGAGTVELVEGLQVTVLLDSGEKKRLAAFTLKNIA